VASYAKERLAVPTFPAASVQLADTVTCAPSGPAYGDGPTHTGLPLVASVAVATKDSAWLYHPFESALRDGERVTLGLVASYDTMAVAVPVFPTASTQVPVIVTLDASGPLYVCGGVQETTPPASLPVVVNVTELRYQPLLSGGREGDSVTAGPVVSTTQLAEAGVDRVPSIATARTRKACGPSLNEVRLAGLAQTAYALASSAHSNVAPA